MMVTGENHFSLLMSAAATSIRDQFCRICSTVILSHEVAMFVIETNFDRV